MVTRIVPFADGMKVGIGYNRLSGDRLPTPAVQGVGLTSMQGGGGQRVTSSCSTTKDVKTLHKSLGISIDAGGSYMGFSGNAKVDYANSCDFSNFSTYVIVAVKVADAAETLDSPVFTPDALELLTNNNPERFRQRFGDTFIAGVLRGGEFFAIYQITGTDEAEKEDVASKVTAAYNGGPLASASLNTDIKTATNKTQSNLTVTCYVCRQGTISTADLTLEDVLASAKQFPIGVSGDKAVPYAVILQDYDGLKSPNDAFVYEEIQNRQDVLEDLAKKRFAFLALRDDLSYMLKHPGDFNNADGTPVSKAELSKAFDEVVAAINAMQTQASACARDAKHCQFTQFDIAKFNVPSLRKTDKILIKAEPNSWPGSLAMQVLGSSANFSVRAKLLTDFSEQKTRGFMGVGLGLVSEKSRRIVLLLKGVGSGGRSLRGGIHTLDGKEGIELGMAQAYGEDEIYLRMSKSGDRLEDVSFSKNGEDWSVFAQNVDLVGSGFEAGASYKLMMVAYSTCELAVSGKFSEVRFVAL